MGIVPDHAVNDVNSPGLNHLDAVCGELTLEHSAGEREMTQENNVVCASRDGYPAGVATNGMDRGERSATVYCQSLSNCNDSKAACIKDIYFTPGVGFRARPGEGFAWTGATARISIVTHS